MLNWREKCSKRNSSWGCPASRSRVCRMSVFTLSKIFCRLTLHVFRGADRDAEVVHACHGRMGGAPRVGKFATGDSAGVEASCGLAQGVGYPGLPCRGLKLQVELVPAVPFEGIVAAKDDRRVVADEVRVVGVRAHDDRGG